MEVGTVSAESAGDKAEKRAQEIASRLGIADFVYGQPLVRKGRGWREVGDGLLVVANSGAILQVKSREPTQGLRDSKEKAERVARKYIEAAIRQGYGSKRTIQSHVTDGKPLSAIPVRAHDYPTVDSQDFALELSGSCERWPIIVILDHPRNPSFSVSVPPGIFCISLLDWERLHEYTRSVSGILRYIDAVFESRLPTVIGREEKRFAELVGLIQPELPGRRESHPWFSTAARDDPVGVSIYRELLSKAWTGLPRGPGISPEEVRTILAFLDDVPTSVMAKIGRWILRKRREFKETGKLASGAVITGNKILVYLHGSEQQCSDQMQWTSELTFLTLTRLHEWTETYNTKAVALGVGTRETEGGIEYTHVYLEGAGGLTKDIRDTIEWKYGVHNFRFGHVRRYEPGRNAMCPCRSGKKYKRCHGGR
ncbi:SEC-C domain-containing protein [Microbispora rosea]|uniref:YecA family protein n=1 Tax=Microbispora rosea TaxID=58117 RepID=UPI0034323E43